MYAAGGVKRRREGAFLWVCVDTDTFACAGLRTSLLLLELVFIFIFSPEYEDILNRRFWNPGRGEPVGS
jgi:hypothetical protein